ncbi:MAG: hypothetical protein ACLFVB_05370 [Thermoplasmata archaeon]
MLDINTEELILIYLEGFDELRNESEVPYGMTPRGIIEGIRASEEETYNSLESLVDDDLVEEDVRSVTGLENKRNVYFLSEKG